VIGNASQHVSQIGFRIEAIQLRRSNQTVYRCRTFATGVGSRKQIILPANSNCTQRTLRPSAHRSQADVEVERPRLRLKAAERTI
jgi:hypothetical protein